MNIGYFASTFPVVSETFIQDAVNWQRAQGHKVTMFADTDSALPWLVPLEQSSLPLMGLKNPRLAIQLLGYLLHSRAWKNPWAMKKLMGRIPFLRSPQSPSLSPHGTNLNPLRQFLGHAQSFAATRQEYDILHAHFGHNGTKAVLLRDTSDIPIVTTFHGYDVYRDLNNNPRVYDLLFSRGNLFLPCSVHMKKVLVANGCPEHKTYVHHMGVDPFKFAPHPPHQDMRVLSVCRLVKKKGLEYAIRAVAELQRRGLQVIYTICGSGPLFGALKKLAEDLRAEINWMGSVSHEEVVEQFKTHDIFISPSIVADTGDQEGIPVGIMEAMSAGLSVVSTYHSGIPELVSHGISGFLSAEKDVSGLVTNLLHLQSPDARRQYGEAGRQTVLESFNNHVLYPAQIKLYEELKESRSRSAFDHAGSTAG